MIRAENTVSGVSTEQLNAALDGWLERAKSYKKVLIVAPDITRFYSRAGIITSRLYEKLSPFCKVDVLIALGSHVPMTQKEAKRMYPAVPYERIINHNWRQDVEKLGQVPAGFVREVSGGLCDFSIDVEINRLITSDYDAVLSIGQVVPHEVVGMANGNKNLFVGCGGASMINSSHMLGAVCDMEKVMGRDFSPVRKVFDYAERKYLGGVNVHYFQTVISNDNMIGLYISEGREAFESAVKTCQENNIVFLDEPIQKVVVYLEPEEFRSTWLGNKAIYRTRMAIADGGELIVIAKGVERFGEDEAIDLLIRKYGYIGRARVLEAAQNNDDLKGNLSAAAHLIHGSSDGRFKITYAVSKLSREEVEQVNFNYADYEETVKRYDPEKLTCGFNTVDGERVFYISNPALGLWACRDKFFADKKKN
ncbi:MAG: lactate racemase domain-containing protein [Clostridia bacterium]|nr:lactate racemase domain-containing protein [Clostridia bacterium]